MRLLALSDLHINHGRNRAALENLKPHPEDWLILGGDLCEKLSDLAWVFETLGPKFAKLIWVPGNHELYAVPEQRGGTALRGVERYEALCDVAEDHGVIHPESDYPSWPGWPGLVLCPMFLLYDYSFAPEGMTPEQAVAWAAEKKLRASDELYLHPDPHPTRQAWCEQRLAVTESRLERLDGKRTVLINHWPLRLDLVRLFRIPRFAPWCGTRATEDWHTRFNAECVVSGHLHMRATDWRDGHRFEEVSLGYPRHWNSEKSATHYLRQILPSPARPDTENAGPTWHR